MRFLISIFLTVCLTSVCSGQTQSMLFEKWWGTNDGCILYYADDLSNGDYILIGGRKSTLYPPGVGEWQHYVCRMNFKGDILWEKEIGNPYAHDYPGGITKTKWGTYLIVGTTQGGDTLGGYYDIEAFNIDANGSVLFEKYFTSAIWNHGGEVIETTDSCFVFLCKLGIPSTFNEATGIIKIDRNGNEIWRHRMDTIPGYFNHIRQTSDSGYIALGSGAAYGNCFYAKFNPAGIMQWLKYPFGLVDTIPNYPNALRTNAEGSFDICYGTNYILSNNDTVWSLFKHYDVNGICLSTSLNKQRIATTSIDKPGNIVWGTYSSDLYIMEEDSLFHKKVGIENDWDISHKYVNNFIKTSDGGYLGVGQYTYDNQNVEPQFYLAKFGDSRYKPKEFSESVNVYPNPSADGNISLTFDILTDENVQVDIYTIEGKLIYSNSIFCPANSHTELPVRLDELSASGGMYILQARTSLSVIRKKFIVGSDKSQ